LKWVKDPRMVCLEDLPKTSGLTKLMMWGLCFVLPSALIEKLFLPGARAGMQDPATLLFTSGSTGIPKGVPLSHANIQSNVQGLIEVFRLDSDDTMVGVLPFFHSFGLTGTIWYPLLAGIPVYYHRSPLEVVAVQKAVRDNKASVLLGTPTFLQMWMRKFKKEDVSSLHFILTGAEKLRDSLAQEFFDQFGVPVLEGYGCTELSPAACVSVLNVQDRHEFQLGHKAGSVGRPLPGVSVRIVDFDSGAPVPQGTPGLLLVKGPNVMAGYWRDPQKSAEVLRDGWYVTGDVAMVDDDGFVKITDRLSRFSKIAGEMVPHILIEEKIQQAAASAEAQFLVTAVKDDKKGECLVVLTYKFDGKIDELVGKLKTAGLPPLWIPDAKNFFALDEWPTLGTGKVDMVKAKDLAEKQTAARAG
jgi:acyl-[acyl-carrier-protein]-phospholipid O-acyltransferase/long-chain-fatty-acid--[acyl-carrier-protein] ligase